MSRLAWAGLAAVVAVGIAIAQAALRGSFERWPWAEHYAAANAAYVAGLVAPWAIVGFCVGYFALGRSKPRA